MRYERHLSRGGLCDPVSSVLCDLTGSLSAYRSEWSGHRLLTGWVLYSTGLVHFFTRHTRYRSLSSLVHSLADVTHTRIRQPGLTKSRDTVTLFNLLKRDQDHVFSKSSCFKAQISNPCISIGSICPVTSTTSKLRFCAGAFSLMSLKELRTEHLLLKIVCDDN